MSEIIKKIEKDNSLEKITVDGFYLWPMIKFAYFYRIIGGEFNEKRGKSIISTVKNLVFGFTNWISNYEAIFISDSSQSSKKIINGMRENRFCDPIIKKLEEKKIKTLNIEIPVPQHFPNKNNSYKNLVSITPINLIAKIIEKTYIRKNAINNIEIINKIKNEYNIKQLDEYKIYKKFYSEFLVWSLIYKIYKPNYVFLTCYYDNLAAVVAAKDNEIKVIEIQHGFIGKTHQGYNYITKIPNRYFPDYLLSFGEYEKNSNIDTFIIEKDKIIPIGHYYIDLINSQNIDLKIKDENVVKVLVTLQETIQDKLIEFILESTEYSDKIFYDLLPRNDTNIDVNNEFVKVLAKEDFYQIIRDYDLHVTVYSTCAIEAPSLNVPNILVNIDDVAQEIYLDILDPRTSVYVNSPSEFVKEIESNASRQDKKYAEYNSTVIAQEYDDKVQRALSIIL